MNRNSQNREDPVRGTPNEPIDEGQPLPPSVKYHNEPSGPVIGFEERIKRGERAISATKRLVIGIASLVSLVCVVTKVSIIEVSEIVHRIKPAASSTSTLHPEPARTNEPVHAPSPDAMAINQSANNDAAVVMDNSGVNLDSRPVTKKKRRRDPRETRPVSSRRSPTVETHQRKIIEPFTLPLGVVVAFHEEGRVVRTRKLASPATLQSSWGNSQAVRR